MHIFIDIDQNNTHTHTRTVHVAKAGGLPLLGVVQATGPVDGNVGLLLAELDGAVQGGAGVELAELVQAVKDRAVGGVSGVEPLHARRVLAAVVGRDLGQELDVVVRVELRHLAGHGRVGPVAVHAPVEAVREDEVVRQLEAVRLHGVGRAVVKERLRCVLLLFFVGKSRKQQPMEKMKQKQDMAKPSVQCNRPRE
jgi:hypothetical protein